MNNNEQHSRLKLHEKLVELLGSKNVYYQPPETLKMEYPAIRYSISDKTNSNADDLKYLKSNEYEITIIDKIPDNKVIEKILELPYTSFIRHYTADNLNHDVILIYY